MFHPPLLLTVPVTEEVLNPLICFSCDPIMFQLMNDKAMADLIKCFEYMIILTYSRMMSISVQLDVEDVTCVEPGIGQCDRT
jgi:hypothetical protein